MDIDTIKLGDKVRDSDPRLARDGEIIERVGAYVAIEWNTGKVTKVNVGRLHRDAHRRTGVYLVPPEQP
jgi:ribosomal protein S16